MSKGIVIVKSPQVIQVMSEFPIFPKFQQFSFIATEDQTDFTLPTYPLLSGLLVTNISGLTLDPFNGDFTVNGNILTINKDIDDGQVVSGFYQAMAPDINPLVVNYRSFFYFAAEGQTVFPLGFIPQAILYVAVNGILQSAQDGDYSITGNILTLSQGLNLDDKLFGLAIQ